MKHLQGKTIKSIFFAEVNVICSIPKTQPTNVGNENTGHLTPVL